MQLGSQGRLSGSWVVMLKFGLGLGEAGEVDRWSAILLSRFEVLAILEV